MTREQVTLEAEKQSTDSGFIWGFENGAKWMQDKQSAELSCLRSALLEIANMRGSDQLHRCWDIAIKALNQ